MQPTAIKPLVVIIRPNVAEQECQVCVTCLELGGAGLDMLAGYIISCNNRVGERGL